MTKPSAPAAGVWRSRLLDYLDDHAADMVADLAGLIGEVIDSLTPLEREVQDLSGRWYSIRISPYVTLDSKIDDN